MIVPGQIRDVNNTLHTLTQLRLSVRDINWKPVSPVLSKLLLAEAASNYAMNDSKIPVTTGIVGIKMFSLELFIISNGDTIGMILFVYFNIITLNLISELHDAVSGNSFEINWGSPWFDSWREALWSCLEMTEHDFTRHYLATFLVVSSSHPNPIEQFQQLNENLQQLIVLIFV